MKNTFNGKSNTKNLIAVILGLIGIFILTIAWLYHILVQLITMPKERWLNPFNKTTWKIDDNYPNGFCYYFCNIEATMISHLCILRVGFDDDYCHKDDVSENSKNC